MKKFIILSLFLFNVIAIIGQDEGYYSIDEEKDEKKSKKTENRWVFGGDLGLSFGTLTYIEVSPVAMYLVTPRFMVGPGLIYVYENYKPFHYESSTYGIRTLATFSLLTNLNESIGINIGDIVLHAQNEIINKDRYTIDGIRLDNDGRGWIDNLLVGGGIYQRFGERGGGLSILLLFDVTQNKYSSYSNPTIKIGFFF